MSNSESGVSLTLLLLLGCFIQFWYESLCPARLIPLGGLLFP